MTDPVPVDPNVTRTKLVEFIRQVQAKALEFPADSLDRVFLQGQAVGAYQALREMSLDIAAACAAAGVDTDSLN